MKILKMLFGICDTGKPGDDGCWTFSGNRVSVGMKRAREILTPGGAVRLEGKGLPDRILLFQGLDGKFYAVKNQCSHVGKRRIDPTVERDRIKCCSVMGTVYNYNGEVVSGPAKKPLKCYPVSVESGRLMINLA